MKEIKEKLPNGSKPWKGYKAFNKGLICRGFQYKENEVFKMKHAKLCKSGFHYCENPLDVLDYYDLIEDNGDLTEFAEVESLERPIIESGKAVTRKIKIGTKLNLPDFIKAIVEFARNQYESGATIISHKNHIVVTKSINFTKIVSGGDFTKNTNSGNHTKTVSNGSYTKNVSSGDGATNASGGYSTTNISGGNRTINVSSGNCAKNVSSGHYTKNVSCGNYANNISNGYDTYNISSGDNTINTSSGKYSNIISTGKNTVNTAIGKNSKIKAALGNWITLAEYDNDGICICVKSAQIDGNILKADTWYELKNCKFVEFK